MAEISIRAVEAGDFNQWSALWEAYLAFYETSLPQTHYRHAFDQLLSADITRFRGLLAVVDGQPVGLVHYVFHPHMWRAEGICYLQDLFVTPELRGTGAGRKLIEAVYAAADAHGVPKVYWLTQEDNYAGRMLYDRVGVKTAFVRYDRPVS